MAATVEQPKSPWLAISFGCCASRRDVEEDSAAALRANGETEMKICYDQPQPIARPRADPLYGRPSTSHSMGKHVSQWVASGRGFATRASSRASVHTLTRPRRSASKPRPSIGRPMDFRHNDGFDPGDGIQTMLDDAPMPVRRRRSFRPLELSIYVDPDNRLSDLPDFTMLEWDGALAGLEPPAQALVRERDSRANSIISNPSTSSYMIQRKPIGSGSRRSSVQSQSDLLQLSRPVSGTLQSLYEQPRSRPESLVSIPTTLARSSTRGSVSSPRRMLSRVSSPNRSRSNTDSSITRGNMRRAKTDVDDAIRELNTIVEERRADAFRSKTLSPEFINRPPPSPSHHIPVVAPSMRMHVRSETLSDIGSAFSVPLASKPLPTPPPPPGQTSLSRAPTKLSVRPPSRANTLGPLNSNPITPPTPTVPTPTTPIARLGAWIKRSLPSTPASPSFFKSAPTTPKTASSSNPPTPFYQCEPPLPPSRPSTAGSRTLAHTRQDSADTATVTLLSSYPSTPALSTTNSRAASPTSTHSPPRSPPSPETPATPARVNLLKGQGKARKIPAPLNLEKKIMDQQIEKPLNSARSVNSTKSLKPPPSPHYGILKGMEISVRPKGAEREGALSPSPIPVTPVGVAF